VVDFVAVLLSFPFSSPASFLSLISNIVNAKIISVTDKSKSEVALIDIKMYEGQEV
jgi:hypothetical protein